MPGGHPSFGDHFGKRPVFSGVEQPDALLSNAARAHALFGLPRVPLARMIAWTAAWVRDYAEGLRGQIAIPIAFWDESLTTVEATAALHAQGRRGRKVKERVDAVAATLILQSYLDAQSGDAPYG